MNPFPLVTDAEGRKTNFKIFPSHGRRLFTGSQTDLEECRRTWNLQPKISTTETTEGKPEGKISKNSKKILKKT